MIRRYFYISTCERGAQTSRFARAFAPRSRKIFNTKNRFVRGSRQKRHFSKAYGMISLLAVIQLVKAELLVEMSLFPVVYSKTLTHKQ